MCSCSLVAGALLARGLGAEAAAAARVGGGTTYPIENAADWLICRYVACLVARAAARSHPLQLMMRLVASPC